MRCREDVKILFYFENTCQFEFLNKITLKGYSFTNNYYNLYQDTRRFYGGV